MKNKINSLNDAINILEKIKESIKRDIGPIIEYYHKQYIETKIGVGFFAVLRCIFPEIDGLGSYYKGTINNTAKNATEYIRDYFGRINLEYKRKGAFIYQVYRHGLMHQHTPAFLLIDGKKSGWSIGISFPLDPRNHLQYANRSVNIDVHQFYEDLLSSIDLFRRDIEAGNNELLKNLITAHGEMHYPISKEKLLQKPFITEADFKFVCE